MPQPTQSSRAFSPQEWRPTRCVATCVTPKPSTRRFTPESYDILVNCAGINIDRTATKLTLDDWQNVIATNLTGNIDLLPRSRPQDA